MDTILQRTVTPIIVLTETPAEIEPIAQLYQRQLDRSGGKALLGGILTLQGLVPGRQTEKLEVIERLRQKLTPAVQSRLDAGTRRLVDEWLPRQRLTTFSQSDLPASLLRQFAEKDGTLGRMVLLFPRYGISTTDARIVQGLADEARSVPLPASAQIAGSYLIFADMLSSISHDGPIATIIAFFCVFVLSLLLARGARGGIQVAVSLVVGVLWTVGLAAAGGMRLNFLNFIALPITFGIGVDYATNVYGRYRLSPPGRHAIIRAVSHSGAAVAACSATTMIGYSSLLLSRNGALFSFGLLAVVGELACLAAALLVLPAALCIRASDRVAPLPVNEGPG
jgi:hypothetical protein